MRTKAESSPERKGKRGDHEEERQAPGEGNEVGMAHGLASYSYLKRSETIRRAGTPNPASVSSTLSIIGAGPQTK
jgi:hypothetical protein